MQPGAAGRQAGATARHRACRLRAPMVAGTQRLLPRTALLPAWALPPRGRLIPASCCPRAGAGGGGARQGGGGGVAAQQLPPAPPAAEDHPQVHRGEPGGDLQVPYRHIRACASCSPLSYACAPCCHAAWAGSPGSGLVWRQRLPRQPAPAEEGNAGMCCLPACLSLRACCWLAAPGLLLQCSRNPRPAPTPLAAALPPLPCRVSAIDSGKPLVDAAFGEVIVTCEKIWWLVQQGERYLRPEPRSAGTMVRCWGWEGRLLVCVCRGGGGGGGRRRECLRLLGGGGGDRGQGGLLAHACGGRKETAVSGRWAQRQLRRCGAVVTGGVAARGRLQACPPLAAGLGRHAPHAPHL
jgi:hypothetical protein